MQLIENKVFDQERALYGSNYFTIRNCRFDGPADGESALKESNHICVQDCQFNLRYPFWHNTDLQLAGCTMTENCRAALWYCQDVTIENCRMHGIKALRECANVSLRHCDILSAEFGWSVDGITMENVKIQGEYVMLRSRNLRFDRVQLKGKYSFQYIEDALFDNCVLDTKDAFWHAKNVTVRNCTVKGEYLAWYSENIIFDHCRIIGTQPLCYCKGLKLIDCEMIDTDLCFEKSQVDADITTPVVSIKNPLSGQIYVPAVGDVILDDPNATGKIIVDG